MSKKRINPMTGGEALPTRPGWPPPDPKLSKEDVAQLQKYHSLRQGIEKTTKDGKVKAILYISEMPFEPYPRFMRWLLEGRTLSIRSNCSFELADDAVINAEQAAEQLNIKIVYRMPILLQNRPSTDYEGRQKLLTEARALLFES